MKSVLIPAAAFAAALAVAPADAQNVPPAYREQHRHEHDHDHGHGLPADQASLIRQRVDALSNELDYIQEHLEEHLEEGHVDQASAQLFRQADEALREAVHFRRSIRTGAETREVYDHFRVLDGQVHALMQAVQNSNDAPLRRAASRLAFADEQLHAAVARGAGQTTGEFIARQAHVLAGEAQRLERSARAVIAQQDHHEEGDHRGDRELIDALHDFVDKVEHFHETAENENDPGHLAEDFAIVDQSWHRVVDRINRNPHGAYLYRRAQRVGAMHDDLSRVIGVKTERRPIRFNVGRIGIQLGR